MLHIAVELSCNVISFNLHMNFYRRKTVSFNKTFSLHFNSNIRRSLSSFLFVERDNVHTSCKTLFKSIVRKIGGSYVYWDVALMTQTYHRWVVKAKGKGTVAYFTLIDLWP